jgi:hypothetical protein
LPKVQNSNTGGLYRLNPIRQRIISAIPALGSRVTASDLATATGFPVAAVNLELNQIASDTDAVLEVSNQGTLVYVFSKNVEAAYAARGLRLALEKVCEVGGTVTQFIIRSSFGVLLIYSVLTLLAIFAVAMIIILFAADASDGQVGDLIGEGEGDLDFDFFDIANLACFFTWWRFSIEPQFVNYYGRQIDLREKGFISNCYSFLFGDGNPNRHFEDEMWKQIAELIRRNNGVITKEQIAPYMLKCRKDNDMFPVLVRFNGTPEVTDTGNIVYLFPEMMQSTGSALLRGVQEEAFSQEKPWKFTEISVRRLDFVFYFAGANLAGWYALFRIGHHAEWLQPYTQTIQCMFIYACFFIAYPILRQLCNSIRNGVVEFNNNCRRRAFEALAKPEVQHKLYEARSFAQGLQVIGAKQVVYSSGRDDLEQQFEQHFSQ